MEKREKGIVIWFSAEKGFGFIAREDNKGDIFVHFQDIDMDGYKTLEKGEIVEFDVENTAKGNMAKHVKVLDTEG